MIIAKGYSMSPVFKEGDSLKIYLSPWKTIRWGDIVIFKLENRILAHRVLYKTKTVLYVKGDNTQHFEKIGKKQYIGKIINIKTQYGIYHLHGIIYRIINLYFIVYSILLFIFGKNAMDTYIIRKFFRGKRLIIRILCMLQQS